MRGVMSIESISPQSAGARHQLGQLASRDIVALAHQWLGLGLFTESLNELCFLRDPQMADVAPIFAKALRELSVVAQTRSDAATFLVNETLHKIASEELEPVNGASYLYWDVHHTVSKEVPDQKFVGDGLGLERVFAWLREVWDCRDGSRILYYNDRPRAEAELKFIEHIRDEARKYVAERHN